MGILVSLVIPCYNEEGNLKKLLEKAEELVYRQPSVECIFVNNGSTDNSHLILEDHTNVSSNIKVASVALNMGYGFGIKKGLEIANGDIVGWTHADLQTDPLDVIKALHKLGGDSGLLLIKGKRMNRPASDRIFTLGMSIFESILFRTVLRDINAQPTLFSRELLSEVLNGPDDFSLDLYTLVVSRKKGYREIRIPVNFGPRNSGVSKWNTSVAEKLRFIHRTIKYSRELSRSLRKP